MLSDYLANLTPEERTRIREEANQRRQEYIQQAINNGAKVTYISSVISGEEQETHIRWSQNSEIVTIDSTIRSDMVRIIKCGYKIIEVSKYKNAGSYDDETLCGIIAECPKNKISMRIN